MDKEVENREKANEVQKDVGKETVVPRNIFIRTKNVHDTETGKASLQVEMSNGVKLDDVGGVCQFREILKGVTGTDDLEQGIRILWTLASGMGGESFEERFNQLAVLLPAFKPQSEIEALLLGQFIALQDSGMKCIARAKENDSLHHFDKCMGLATKLLRVANETMQTVAKIRTGGRQEIQIVHVHNEGQAIVTQNLASGGGGKKI